MYCKHKEPLPEGIIGPRVNYLSRLVRRRFNEVIAEEGLFSGQQDILFAIVDNEGVTSSKLSSMAGVSAATISVSVKRMEKAGFIIKKADENDARISRLYPTKKARALPENIRYKMNALEETLCSGMSREDVLRFSSYLQLAIKNLCEQSGQCLAGGDNIERDENK